MSPTPPATITTSAPPPEQNSGPQRAQRALIPPDQLPGFNPQWRWTLTAKLRDLASPCTRSTMVGIGAVREAGRRYLSSGLSTLSTVNTEAVQLTGVFPDEHTALTSAAVLTAWHDKCAQTARQQGFRHVWVSGLRDVTTPVGTGHQWMLTYRPVAGEPDSVWFVSQGFVRDGDTITFLAYRSAGQDYNYPRGQEPIDRALRVAAKFLKASR